MLIDIANFTLAYLEFIFIVGALYECSNYYYYYYYYLVQTTQDVQRRLESAQKLLDKVNEQAKKSTEKIKSLLIEKVSYFNLFRTRL